MIPRTRPSFSLADLAEAALVREGSGGHKERLATQLRDYLGAREVLLTASGRSALHAILRASGRSRVVVPAYTCNAVVEAATLAGKQVDYAEIERGGFNVDPNALEPLLGPDAVFIATHQFGIPCDIERIVAMCRARGALVVEDAAASLGTRVSGRLTGTFGDAAFFSFDVSKLVNVPLKGGAAIAPDPQLFDRVRAAHAEATTAMPPAAKARLLASAAALVLMQGPRRYRAFHALRFERSGTFTAETPEIATTPTEHYRHAFTDWQASVAVGQMDRIDQIVARRRALYAAYEERLRGATSFSTPPRDVAQEWAPIRFPIRVHGDKLAFYRAAAERGVDFAFSFTFITAPRTFEASHALARAVLDLPFYPDLEDEELERTVDVLTALDRERARRPSRASVSVSC
ncbi:MAG: DegT/DnrJ/EryC1/StrS family aminotransferase [Labilithrix sp.]|nr:DegT/DnrJ/EryC1/StrS family aminotransferase [Labilithrix sp.]